jgi:hypothetical protein
MNSQTPLVPLAEELTGESGVLRRAEILQQLENLERDASRLAFASDSPDVARREALQRAIQMARRILATDSFRPISH